MPPLPVCGQSEVLARQSPSLTQLASKAGVQCDLEPIIESEIERDLFEAERPTEKGRRRKSAQRSRTFLPDQEHTSDSLLNFERTVASKKVSGQESFQDNPE